MAQELGKAPSVGRDQQVTDRCGNVGTQAGIPGKEHMAEQPLIDPTSRYPKPPFKKQSQPWPGLAGKMEPKPDHGETSYQGSGRLRGRRALITGGDSGMGRAAAIAYGREGADVAINYFPTEEPDAQEVIALIKKEGRQGIGIPGDLREETFCKSWSSAQSASSVGSTSSCAMRRGSKHANPSSTFPRRTLTRR